MCKKSLKEDQNAFFLPNMTPWNINSCIFRHNLTHRGEKNIAALKETVQNAIKLHVPCNLDFSSLANQCYSLLLALGVSTRLLNRHSEHHGVHPGNPEGIQCPLAMVKGKNVFAIFQLHC